MNILKNMERNIKNNNFNDNNINRFVEFLKVYPIDLMVGIMKDMKSSYTEVYSKAIENEEFIDAYFNSYTLIRG